MRMLILAALLAVALPARAGFGFVFADRPDAAQFETYVPWSTYRHNSAGRINTVTRLWTGYYEVRMPRLMPPGRAGNVQVTAYGDDATYCKAHRWSRLADFDVSIAVQCYDPLGAPRNSRFTVAYQDEEISSVLFAYTALDRPDPATWPVPPGPAHYLPPAMTTFNAGSPGDPVGDLWMRHRGTGRYTVYIHGWPVAHANFLVTATGGGSARCAIENDAFEQAVVRDASMTPGHYRIERFAVDIACARPNGVPANSGFSLAYFNLRTMNAGLGAYLRSDVVTITGVEILPFRPRYFNSVGAVNVVTARAGGLYNVRLAGLARRYSKSTVNVVARGSANEYCKVREWFDDGDDVRVTVACHAGTGAPVLVPFFLHFATDS